MEHVYHAAVQEADALTGGGPSQHEWQNEDMASLRPVACPGPFRPGRGEQASPRKAQKIYLPSAQEASLAGQA